MLFIDIRHQVLFQWLSCAQGKSQSNQRLWLISVSPGIDRVQASGGLLEMCCWKSHEAEENVQVEGPQSHQK